MPFLRISLWMAFLLLAPAPQTSCPCASAAPAAAPCGGGGESAPKKSRLK